MKWARIHFRRSAGILESIPETISILEIAASFP
jgi:hypothetical protein